MTIRVRLFARLRDVAGTDVLSVEMPNGATVADLRRCVGEEYPQLGGLVAKCAVAIGEEFGEETTPLREGVEAALLPPVSGGAISR